MGLSNAWATHPAANYCAQDDSSPHQLEATRVFGRISRGRLPAIIDGQPVTPLHTASWVASNHQTNVTSSLDKAPAGRIIPITVPAAARFGERCDT